LSAFGACLRAHIGSFLPALVAFAGAPCDDIGQIIAAVIVGNLAACSDVLDGPYDDLVPYPVGLGIRPARMICVTSEVLSARSVDRPTAIDLVEIAVAPGLKFIGLLGGKLAAFYSTMKAPFLIGAVAKRPRPVRERPIRKALLRAMSDMYDDSRPRDHIGREREWSLSRRRLRAP
jgi:hypothetical protein